MSNLNLKPCPFCGTAAILERKFCGECDCPIIRIRCPNELTCGLQPYTIWVGDCEENLNKIVSEWNCRAPQARHGYGTPDMAGMGVVNGG